MSMENWAAVKARLEEVQPYHSCLLNGQEVRFANVRLADIRAALDRISELERHWEERQEWRTRMGLKTTDVVVLENGNLREALEQIDRETRSASDVAALRYGSIARAALAAARGGE